MARAWCKISVSLDAHPRIRKAGNLGRQVFEFALRRNAELDRGGIVPAHHLDPEYLADVLMLDGAQDAIAGLERCVRAGLLAPSEDGYAICGWDDDWAKYPMSDAERQRLSRASRGYAARAPEHAASSTAPSTHPAAPRSGSGSHVRAAELVPEHAASPVAPSAELAPQHRAREPFVSATKHSDVTKCHDAIVTESDGHECHGSDQIRGDQIRGDQTQRESARARSRPRDHALQNPGTSASASNRSPGPDVTICHDASVTGRDCHDPSRTEQSEKLSTGYTQTQESHTTANLNGRTKGTTDWHRRNAVWLAFLSADDRIRCSGVEPNGLPLPRSLAGQNERNLVECFRELGDSFDQGQKSVDDIILHVIAVYEDEAIGKRTRRWFRPAVVFNPKTILDKAATAVGYWRQTNGHGAKPSSARAAGAIEAQLERVAQLEAKEAS